MNVPSTPEENSNDFSRGISIYNLSSLIIINEETIETDTSELNVDLDSLAEESSQQAFFKSKIDLSDMIVKTERKAPRQAQWFPMLLSPSALDGSFAGDVGFDPLGNYRFLIC